MKREYVDRFLQELRDAWVAADRAHTEWRYGQALFNTLYFLHPRIADQVRASAIDPFHNDSNVDACLAFVKKELEKLTCAVCSVCDKGFAVSTDKSKPAIPTHDHPKPCRIVCPGSGKEGKA